MTYRFFLYDFKINYIYRLYIVFSLYWLVDNIKIIISYFIVNLIKIKQNIFIKQILNIFKLKNLFYGISGLRIC